MIVKIGESIGAECEHRETDRQSSQPLHHLKEDDRVPRCGDSDRQRHEGGCPCQPVGVGHDSPHRSRFAAR
nr:hypothetical protein [Acinetobacter baumannii]